MFFIYIVGYYDVDSIRLWWWEPKMFIIMLCKQPILVGTNIFTSLLTASRTEKKKHIFLIYWSDYFSNTDFIRILKKSYCKHESMIFLILKHWIVCNFYFTGGQRRPPPTSPVQGVVVVVIPRMALIWLMTKSLIMPMRRSSIRPLLAISPASLSSVGTGLAKAREQTRKQTRRVLIIFSWG